ncbi:hypothetical protein EXM22_07360 [Oceanispirochaeta crateris]|uniref:Uncharacterized protein n=1 Tax=Oceanispirochaeta crateris TaxID=2518645 RepID=A0A5C1QI37_9SPIO|nr:hypothetical protein [Oceanispirochaeta crateris]QEN07815.1 hypothetical protein EXM22_07360 [Oceanispirochaeta crateris]
MRRIGILCFLFFSLTSLFSVELVLINKTETPLFEVYAVPADTENWGYDKLPFDVILPGDYVVLEVELDEEKPINFRFVDEDGDLYLKYNVDISSRRKILILPEDHQLLSSEGLIRFTLVNKTGSVIRALYISSETEDEWGDNLLDEFLLESGEMILDLQTSGRSSFYDIRLELAGESIVKKRVFISDRARVLLTLH